MPSTTKPTGEFARGWPTLVAATIGVGLGTTGLPFYGFGQFIRPLAADFHWSRGEIAGGILCSSIATVLISPFVGSFVQRFGARSTALLCQLGLAAGFLLLSFVQSRIWTFYAAWFALALLGAGTSPIVWTRAVAGAFDRHRGLALGIMLSGTGVAAILAPLITGPAIAAFGWRGAYRLLGCLPLLIGMPVTALLLRDARPGDGTDAASASDISLSAALRGSPFWRIVIAFILISVGVAGLIVHLPALLADRGVGRGSAAIMAGSIGYAVIAGRLLLGILLDTLPPAAIGSAFILLASIACLLIASHVAMGAPMGAAVLLLGLCAGAEVDLLAYLVSRLFGMRHYALIYGCCFSAFMLGAGIGPVLAGSIHDRTGSYGPALVLFAASTVCAAALIASLGKALATAVRVRRSRNRPANP